MQPGSGQCLRRGGPCCCVSRAAEDHDSIRSKGWSQLGGHLIDDDVGEALLASRHQLRHAEASLLALLCKYAASGDVLPLGIDGPPPAAPWLGLVLRCSQHTAPGIYGGLDERHAEMVADRHRLRSLQAPPLALVQYCLQLNHALGLTIRLGRFSGYTCSAGTRKLNASFRFSTITGWWCLRSVQYTSCLESFRVGTEVSSTLDARICNSRVHSLWLRHQPLG